MPESPEIELFEIPGATVVGGTNFILAKNTVIHPDLFIPSRDLSPAELNGSATINPAIGQIKLYLKRASKKVDRAISLLGQCTGNYAHWLTETLPKLIIVDGHPEYDGLPLLVDDWIHPNFYDSIKLLGNQPRQMIGVGRFKPCILSNVIDVSPPAYIPPEYRAYLATREVVKISHDVFPFSRRALHMLRDASQKAVSSGPELNVGRRLYLRRAPESCGNPRMIANIEKVERLIMKFGFKVIDPGKLSFAEQISVFMNADTIVSAVGAAMANMIFMPSGSYELSLWHPTTKMPTITIFPIWRVFLTMNCFMFSGLRKRQATILLHKDYDVDIGALFGALKGAC